MYNLTVLISPMISEKYTSDCVKASVMKVKINSRDSYETCRVRMDIMDVVMDNNYSSLLDNIEPLKYCFQYPVDTDGEYRLRDVKYSSIYSKIMEKVLKALDPAIDKVEPLISCVSATQYLKKNTDSVRKAVENDLFSIAPSTDLIFEISEI